MKMFSSRWNHSENDSERVTHSHHLCKLEWMSVCMCWIKKTSSTPSYSYVLCLFFLLWLKDVSLLIDINTHRHIHTVRQEGYRCLFRLSGRWACTLRLRSKGPSWHEHLPHATSSAVSHCRKTYILTPRTGEDDAVALLWSLFSLWGPEDELLVRIYVLSESQCCG